MAKQKRKRRSAGLDFIGGASGGLKFLGGSGKSNPMHIGSSKPLSWLGTYKPGGSLFGSAEPKRRTRRKSHARRRHERRESRSYERREHRNGYERRERRSSKDGARIAGAIGAGIMHIAGKGYEAYKKRKGESDRYGLLREKAKRYGFKNLPAEEREEYANAALSRKHSIEG